MNKQEQISRAAEISGLTKNAVAAAYDGVIAAQIEGLQRGEPVHMPNVGTLRSVLRDARVCRSPIDGSQINVPAQNVARFKMAAHLKRVLNGG